jgi:hypothetical protein
LIDLPPFWAGVLVGIGFSGVVCLIVGLVLTIWRKQMEASE